MIINLKVNITHIAILITNKFKLYIYIFMSRPKNKDKLISLFCAIDSNGTNALRIIIIIIMK